MANDTPTLILRTCDYSLLYEPGERGAGDVIKLRGLTWEDYVGILSEPLYSPKSSSEVDETVRVRGSNSGGSHVGSCTKQQ